jgi:hypothetical protein
MNPNLSLGFQIWGKTKGSRFIAWMKPVRGLGVSPLPDDYGFDHYEAAENFLREVREHGM